MSPEPARSPTGAARGPRKGTEETLISSVAGTAHGRHPNRRTTPSSEVPAVEEAPVELGLLRAASALLLIVTAPLPSD
jgi:hypothetical protein